jgi:peptide/nickel transport system substrate-binding protein
LRPLRPGRALLIGIAVLAAACSRAGEAPSKGGPGAAAETRPAAPDPNAENPDRARWADLAGGPFRPEWVGGRVVQIRPALVPSLNAVRRVARSTDVERMHKYLLGAPLLMEVPDRGPDGFQVAPHAAAAMPEVSPDGLTHTWTLRPDLTWEDGRPVTAADYAFTFRMIRNPDVDTTLRDGYRLVESFEEIDARRFRVRWSKPWYRAVHAIGLDFQAVPAHALPADAASFNKAPTHLACGPCRIATFEPATRIELVLRDEYRAEPFPIRPHYVERWVYEGGVRDPTAAMTRLINGDAHIVGLSADQYASEAVGEAFRRAAWRTHFYMPSYSFVAWNLHDPADASRPHPVLGDVRVRKALSHLFQLEAIAASVYHGLARPVSGPFDSRDPGYDPGVPHFAFDPGRAKALLREAGWLPGEKGVLAKDGRPLRLTLARLNRSVFPAVCQTFEEEARKVGAEVVVEDRPGLYEDLENHRIDAAIVLWQIDAIEPDVTSQFHSRFAAVPGVNYSGFADPEVDRALDRIEASPDRAERAALRRDVHRRLHETVPVTFLLANASTVGISRALANVKVHDLGVRFHDFVMRDRWTQ